LTIFENIRHVNKYGNEYWSARELAKTLEYAQWRRFNDVIKRAKDACKNSKNSVSEHFADIGKMVSIGSKTERKISDVALSRYACYLVVQNADPTKELFSLGNLNSSLKSFIAITVLIDIPPYASGLHCNF